MKWFIKLKLYFTERRLAAARAQREMYELASENGAVCILVDAVLRERQLEEKASKLRVAVRS